MEKKEALLLLQMVEEATRWLLGLAEPEVRGLQTPERRSLRVFAEDECESLSLESRRFLLSLEQQGIVDAALRERVIYHVMQLPVKNVDTQVVEGIVRTVLAGHPGKSQALERMDLLMAKMDSLTVH